jgi:hypothetical protein
MNDMSENCNHMPVKELSLNPGAKMKKSFKFHKFEKVRQNGIILYFYILIFLKNW